MKPPSGPGFQVRSVRWPIVSALILGLAVFLPVAARAAADSFAGVGLYAGAQFHADPIWHITDEYDWQEFQGRLLVGEHRTDRWDLWFEITVGTVDWVQDLPDSIEVGATAMTSYDLLQQNGWSLFTELGGGFGWLSNIPDADLVYYPGALGFLDYGAGVKVKMKNGLTFKLGPRFHHRSALMRHDTGMNSYGLMLSVTR